jgi:ankyrin repeat protein
MLDCGADVNIQEGAALLRAASDNHLEVVKLLLNRGAEVNARNIHCGTPLQQAICDIEVVKLLLEHGADVNAKGGYNGTALQRAASGGHLQVVRLLLDHGANINAEDAINGSALQKAASRGRLEIIKLLLAWSQCECKGRI